VNPEPAARPVRLVGEALSHRYGPRLALQPVTFDVGSPGAVAVTGENGSGKSTLLRILMGLQRATSGRLDFQHDKVSLSAHARRHVAGLATPELSFYEEFTASENLHFAAEVRGLADPVGAVKVALDEVELSARAGDRVAEFSSGMKQRLRLAFAILHRPALLMLDEPGSHLDEAGREVVDRLVQSWSIRGLVLIATNDPREIRLAERNIQLRGRGLGGPA
jgi:heme exporter protein A